jgi:hypothetical protein
MPAPTVLPRQGALELGPQVVEVVRRPHALAGPALVRRADQVAQPPGAPGAVVGVAQRDQPLELGSRLGGRGGPHECVRRLVSVASSARSPTTVAVPCASTKPTAAGDTPARS